MCKYNPKIDIVFKKLFGSEENKDLLKSLVNAILPADEQVETLEIKNPYNLESYKGDKGSIMDIKAQAKDGRFFDIEMQIGEQAYFGKRIKYYIDKVYVEQLTQGGLYKQLNKVIGISILDYDYFKDERYVRAIIYKDRETNERYKETDLSDIYFIELQKFKKETSEICTGLDRWITFLNRAGEYEKGKIPKEMSKDESIKKAIEQLDVFYFNKEEREIYEAEQKFRLDIKNELQTAEEKGIKKGMEKGREEGKKEGKNEGREEGKKEGKEEGKKEGREEGKKEAKRELAEKMLKEGLDAPTISKITGLPEESLRALIGEKRNS